MNIKSSVLRSFVVLFSTAGIVSITDLHNRPWKNDQVGLRSVRSMEGFVNSLRASFPSKLMSFVNNVVHNGEEPQTFPVLNVIPKHVKMNESGQVSLLKGYEVLDFQSLGKKLLCKRCLL